MGTTKTQTSKMDPLQQEFLSETLLPFAKDIAGQQYQSYEGERVADMTPLQQQAMGGYGALSMGEPQYAQASQAYGSLANFQAPTAQAAQIGQTPTVQAASLANANIGQYMSPYTNEVINRTQQDIARQQQSAQNTLGAEATRAGAFGGSRHGVAEGTLAGEYGRMAGDVAAQQRAQAFQNAQAAAQTDVARQQQAALQQASMQQMTNLEQAALQQQAALANQQAGISGAGIQATGAAGLGSIAGQQLQSQLAGLGAQMQAGEAARMLDQARKDVPYQDYLAAMQYPLTQFGVLTGAAGAFPAGIGTQTQSTGGLGPALGAIGSAGKGLAAMGFMPFSDERLKENVKKIGSRNGVNLYAWRWTEKAKAMGADSMPATGVIAQEIEADYPQHIYVGNDGYRRVNYIGLFNELG